MKKQTIFSRVLKSKAAGGKVCTHQRGTTLVELLIAMTVLSIGMVGCLPMLLLGMSANTSNRNDTAATTLDQEIIERFSTLQQYPKTATVTIYDCSTGANAHLANLAFGSAAVGGAGAPLYTASPPAPTAGNIGDIDWTQPTPVLATAVTPGYAMQYTTCNGDTYEVRWNVTNLDVAPNSTISMLTVSSRELATKTAATNGATSKSLMFSQPITLKTLIEN
jgi:prepilin-type N-terminal cleavage/methylation domain-containing protein